MEAWRPGRTRLSALGTDSNNSSNFNDMFREVYLAAVLPKDSHMDPSVMSAEKAEVVEALRQEFLAEPQPVHGYIGQNLACEAHSALEELGGIQAETLVVVGRRDGQTPVGAASELASNIPNARLEILSGLGHGLVWENPAAFNDLLLSFLDGSERHDP